MKGLKFTDIIITIMIGVIFGIIMKLWDDLYRVVKPIFPVARQLIYGMWFMVAPFAYLLIRKPGVAVLSSVAAAGLSAIIGDGFQVLMYGFVQGLAAEILFAGLRYRSFGIMAGGLAGIASCFGGFFLDWYYGYAELEAWAITVKYGIRAISAFIFTGIFAYLIVRALEAAGATSLIRPIDDDEYEKLAK